MSCPQFSLFSTALGDCGIAWCDDIVVATTLPEQNSNATAARLASRTGGAMGKPTLQIERAIASITALLDGGKTDLSDIACDLGDVSPFEARVYTAARAVPVGETVTYGDIAEQLGDKRFAQNVGRALGRNPLPIIIPCYRVVGANQKLTGFSAYGGVTTKLKMLEIEGAMMARQPGLFD